MKLTQKEKIILFIALNNLQDRGVKEAAVMLKQYDSMTMDPNPKVAGFVDDWIDQTVDEYDLINTLKAKLAL